MLAFVVMSGGMAVRAQAQHRHAPANDQWRKEWQKQWLAKHGGAASQSAAAAATPATATKPAASTLSGARASSTPMPPTTKPLLNSPTITPAVPRVPVAAGMSGQTGEAIPAASNAVKGSPAQTTTSGVPPKSDSFLTAGKTSANLQTPSSLPSGSLLPSGNPQAKIENRKSKIENSPVLAQTRPDVFTANDPVLQSTAGDHTQSSPFASAGDSWKMVAYLLPVLLGIVGCLNLLKRFQARTGRLPGALQSAAQSAGNAKGGRTRQSVPRASSGFWNTLVGSFHLNNARQAGGSSIRLLESVPIGSANVHLLEVRGRVLLLGASPAGLSLLAEFEESGGATSNDFRDLLHAAAADMDALDYAQDDLPATATVSTLEDLMRETGQNVRSNARRLRTVREVEIDD